MGLGIERAVKLFSAQDRTNAANQILCCIRLHDESITLRRAGHALQPAKRVGGINQNLWSKSRISKSVRCGEAAATRHVQVKNDQVRSELLSFLERFYSTLRFAADCQVGFFISE